MRCQLSAGSPTAAAAAAAAATVQPVCILLLGSQPTNTAPFPAPNINAGYDYMGVFQKARTADGTVLDSTTFVPFVKRQLQQAVSQGTHYQWVIIFAGINDLGAGNRTAAAIMPKLIEVR